MKNTRRKFIKNSFIAGLGSLILPPFVKNTYGFPNVKEGLNYLPRPGEWEKDKLTIAWIGHSTMLINFFGKWILTDPVLFGSVGLYFFGTSLGPSRLTPPALSFDELPKPDLILLSHAHMDHMDYPTLEELSDKYPEQIDVITAYNTEDVISDLNWKSLKVMDWGNEFEIHDIKFKALEVKHFGWRFPWEKDRSKGYHFDGRSYNAYLIERNGKKVLFAGDTTNTDKFDILKNENIDVALMPIGAYNPWKRAHCNPEEALQMADNINAKYFIPMHTKTFQQGSEPFEEPISWMLNSAPNYKIKIGLQEIGQTFILG